MKKVIVIGAGPAGLTAAYELLKKGKDYQVVILEESNSIGGISKTVNYKGNRMDIGGHRFFSKEKKVNDFWETIMPLQGKMSYDDKILKRNKTLTKDGPDPEKEDNVMLVRNRVSRIYYRKKFFDYPIRMKLDTFKNMGLKDTFKSGFSYLKSLVCKKKEDNLENFYINRFGKQLYSMFFEKYTEKLWGRHPKQISADWGNQRVKGLSILGVIKDVLKLNKTKETSLIEEYKYPKYGPGELWEEVAHQIELMGGQILMNQKVIKIHQKNHKIVSISTEDKEYMGDIFISSMPLKDLVTNMNEVPSNIQKIAKGLPYRDFITAGILVKKLKIKNCTNFSTINNIVPDCWIYVQEPEVKMGRIQVFNNWSPYMVKDIKNTVWLGLEYFCNEGDELWKMSEKEFVDLAIDELEKMDIIDREDVIDSHQEKVKKAYPAYFDTYKDIDKLIQYLDTVDNLYCIGRNGQHRYNNMDHSMMTAFETVDNILTNKNEKADIWNVNTEQEYHEEVQKDEDGKKTRWNGIWFVIFSLWTLFISMSHELWRDEAQSFMLSKLNFISLIQQLKIEGHPFMWFVLLKIIPIPYEMIWLIPWILTLISIYLILYKMKKPLLSKVIILFCTPILYVSLFARSYSLAILIVVLLSVIYKERYNHPLLYGLLLASLINTHIIFVGLAVSLMLIDIYNWFKNKTEKKKIGTSVLITFIGFILLFLQLIGANGTRTDLFDINRFLSINTFINPIVMFINLTGKSFLGILFLLTFLILLILLFEYRKKESAFIALVSFLGFFGVLMVYFGNYYMHIMFLVVLLFIFWQLDCNRVLNLLFLLLFCCTFLQTYNLVDYDIKNYYSSSKVTSDYIKYNIDSKEKIYCIDTAYCSSIIPYINNYHFIDLKINEEFTYVDWSKNTFREDFDLNKIEDEEVKYVIVPNNLKVTYNKKYKLIYVSPNSAEETYYILERINSKNDT